MTGLDQQLYAYSIRAKAERDLINGTLDGSGRATAQVQGVLERHRQWTESLPSPLRWLLDRYWPIPETASGLEDVLYELDDLKLRARLFTDARAAHEAMIDGDGD